MGEQSAFISAMPCGASAGIPLGDASDHGFSEALYLDDPRWNRSGAVLGSAQGNLAASQGRRLDIYTRPLDLRDLMSEPEPA
jgi:catechol 2,3-dioxygenase